MPAPRADAGPARTRRSGCSWPIIERSAPVATAATIAPCRDTALRFPPDLVAVRRRAAAEERGADARQRRRRAAGPRDRRGLRRLRRRHVAARGASRVTSRARASRRTGHHADHAHGCTRSRARVTRITPTRRRDATPASARPRAGARPGVAASPTAAITARSRHWRFAAGVRRARRRGAAGARVAAMPAAGATDAPVVDACRALGGAAPARARPLPPDRPVAVVALTSLAGTRRRACPSIDGARWRSRRSWRKPCHPLSPRAAPAAARARSARCSPARRDARAADARAATRLLAEPRSTASPSPPARPTTMPIEIPTTIESITGEQVERTHQRDRRRGRAQVLAEPDGAQALHRRLRPRRAGDARLGHRQQRPLARLRRRHPALEPARQRRRLHAALGAGHARGDRARRRPLRAVLGRLLRQLGRRDRRLRDAHADAPRGARQAAGLHPARTGCTAPTTRFSRRRGQRVDRQPRRRVRVVDRRSTT